MIFRFMLLLLSVARGFRGFEVEPSCLVLSTLFLNLFDILHGVLLLLMLLVGLKQRVEQSRSKAFDIVS